MLPGGESWKDFFGKENGEEQGSLSRLLALFVLLLIMVLAYLPLVSKGHTLFIEDDLIASAAGWGPKYLIDAFRSGFWPINFYATKASLLFAGVVPVFNILLWLICGLICFWAFAKATDDRNIAFIAALFVSIHGLTVPEIATISGRGTLLGSIFVFAAIGYLWRYQEDIAKLAKSPYLEHPSTSIIPALACVFFAVLCSPLWIIAPVFFVLATSFSNKAVIEEESEFEENVELPQLDFKKWLAAGLILTIVFAIISGYIIKPDFRMDGIDRSISARIAAGFAALFQDLSLIFYPRSIYYQRFKGVFDAGSIETAIGAAAFIAAAAAAVLIEFKSTAPRALKLGLRLLAAGMAAVALEPVVAAKSPAPSGGTIILIGVALLAAYGLVAIWRVAAGSAAAAIAIIGFLLASFAISFPNNQNLSEQWSEWDKLGSFETDEQNHDPFFKMAWAEYFLKKSSIKSASAALVKIEEYKEGKLNYFELLKARAYKKLKKNEEAVEAYKRFIKKTEFPAVADKARLEMVETLIDLDKFDEAEIEMERFKNVSGFASFLLGKIMERKGEYLDAIDHYQRFRSMTKGTGTDILTALARVYLKLKNYQKAKANIEIALRKDFSFENVKIMLETLMALNNCNQAESLARKSLLLNEISQEDKEELEKMIASLRAVCFGEEQKGIEFYLTKPTVGDDVKMFDAPAGGDAKKKKDDSKTEDKATKPNGAPVNHKTEKKSDEGGGEIEKKQNGSGQKNGGEKKAPPVTDIEKR